MDNRESYCGCGRLARYVTFDGKSNSCNKYSRCAPYSELDKSLRELKNKYWRVLNAAEVISIMREGTESYNKALFVINEHLQELNDLRELPE